MRKLRIAVWVLVAVAAGVSLGLILGGPSGERAPAAVTEGVADIGGPFRLVDQGGSAVTDEDLRGRPSAIFFGFTHCPDVCPTTLYEMATWLDGLGGEAERLNAVFVTVDPERDTPEVMAGYISAFDDRILGLTGSREDVEEMLRAFRVYHRRVDTEGGYTMDHTASVYLMDAEGRFVGTIAYGEADETALGKLRRLIANG